MKILAIRLQNINSFKGYHQIDFEDKKLSQAEIIAITGVTGSGKSTLLDVITLALYNQTPRVQKISQDIIRENGVICTRNVFEDSFAEVDFLVQGKRYRSKWSIHYSKNKNKKLQDYHMELACLSDADNKFFDLKKSEVPSKNAELIGLNFDQFVKSILLSQGEFAKLLKADVKERVELLEKITNTEIYKKIAKLAYDRQKNEAEKLEQLKNQSKNLYLLSEDEQVDLIKEIKDTEDKINQYRIEKNTAEQQHRKWQDLTNWGNQKKTYQAELIKIEQEIDDFESQKKQLEIIENCRVEIVQYEYLENRKKEYKIQEENQQRFHNEICELLEKIQVKKQNIDKEKQSCNKLKSELELKQPVFEEVIKLDNELENDKKRIEEVRTTYTEAKKELKNIEDGIQNITKDLATANKQKQETEHYLMQHQVLASCKEQLSSIRNSQKDIERSERQVETFFMQLKPNLLPESSFHSLKKNLSIPKLNAVLESELQKIHQFLEHFEGEFLQKEEEIEALRKEQDSQNRQYQKIKDVLWKGSSAYKNCLVDIQQMEERLMVWKQEIEQYAQKIKEFEDQKPSLEEKLAVLLVKKERSQLEASHEELRKKMKANEPCYVCGSVHHPYLDGHYENHFSEIEQEYEQLQKTFKNLEKEFNKNQKEHVRLEQIYASGLKKLQENQTKKTDILQHFETECIGDVSVNDIEKVDGFWEEKLQKIEQKGLQLEEIRTRSEYRKKLIAEQNYLQQLDREIGNYLEFQQRYEKDILPYQHFLSAISPSDWVITLEKLTQEFSQEEEKLRELNQNILLWNSKLSDEEKALEKQEQTVQTYYKSGLDLKGTIELKKALRKTKLEDKDPKEEEKKLQDAIQNAQNLEQNAQKECAILETEKRAKEENAAKTTESLDKYKADLKQEEDKLHQQLKQKGLDINMLLQYHLSENEIQELKDKNQKISDLKRDFEQKINNCEEQIMLIKENFDENLLLEELEKQLKEYEKNIQKEIEKIGACRQKMQTHQANFQQNTSLLVQQEQQEKEYKRWKGLADVMGGDATGHKFSTFAQDLTLLHLIYLANEQLKELDTRYQLSLIDKGDGEKQHKEIVVVDTYQGNAQRSIATLSGGETFLVSLAMALGLSDMASRNVKIESLFIDEGFGTLDEETLESALNTLENLQQKTNRMIAIISHVTSLKDRIQTQIRMTKNSSGFSSLEVVG